MAKPSPFKTAIAAYRAALPAPGTVHWTHWKGRLVLKILDDWVAHPQCDGIWEKVGPKWGDPAELILGVIQVRIGAEEADRRVKAWPTLERKMIARETRHYRDKAYSQIATEQLAAGADRFTKARDKLFGRKLSAGPRVFFMATLVAGFKERMGKPFHEEVASLTEVAFGGTVTVDMVRNAGKNGLFDHQNST